MTQRLRGLDDDALGRALAATARQIDWPPSPDLAGRVSGELLDRERQPSLARPRLSLPHRRRTLLLVVAGVVLLAAAAVAAKVVIDLGALTIDTIPGRPTALPSAVASGPTLGHPATIDEAEQEAGFAAEVPEALGAPDAVWVDRAPDGARIVLGWSADDALPAIDGLPWGALLYEFHGEMEQASKSVFMDGNTFEQVQVEGQEGIWITGEHELDVVTDEGTYARYRVTGNVLVWEAGGIVLRLETSLDQAAAVRIAESIPA
jgi:hypothetical protein